MTVLKAAKFFDSAVPMLSKACDRFCFAPFLGDVFRSSGGVRSRSFLYRTFHVTMPRPTRSSIITHRYHRFSFLENQIPNHVTSLIVMPCRPWIRLNPRIESGDVNDETESAALVSGRRPSSLSDSAFHQLGFQAPYNVPIACNWGDLAIELLPTCWTANGTLFIPIIALTGASRPLSAGGEDEHSLQVPRHGHQTPFAAHFLQPAQ